VGFCLKALLDSHAEAEDRYFYPGLLKLETGASDKTHLTRARNVPSCPP
jgi:hypothetical protein